MKKGLSPTIGVVVLVLLVIIISGMVFVWSKDLISNDKEQALGEKMCKEVELAVGDFCKREIDGTGGQEYNVFFSGRNDATGVDLYGFLMIVDYVTGDALTKSISIPSLPYSEMATGDVRSISSDAIKDATLIERIAILPKIEVEGKVFTCEGEEKIMTWGEIVVC
jgi:flagellin-like protein